MAKVESIKCPECGAPLNFEADREFCFCSHCGHQVYKEDVHYDRNMDYKEHKLDVDKELELAKIRQKEREDRHLTIMTIAMIVVIVIGLAIMFLASR